MLNQNYQIYDFEHGESLSDARHSQSLLKIIGWHALGVRPCDRGFLAGSITRSLANSVDRHIFAWDGPKDFDPLVAYSRRHIG